MPIPVEHGTEAVASWRGALCTPSLSSRALALAWATVVGGLLVAGCASRPALVATGPTPSCTMSASDQAWIDRSVQAWRWALPHIVGVEAVTKMQAVLFSADCVLTSPRALTSTVDPSWSSVQHVGTIELPDGDEMPAVVTSFTKVDGDRAWFVMSTPSVWRAGGVAGGPLGLETLMVAVLLHEGIHMLQVPTYGTRISAMIERCPESVGDNSIQERFQADEVFSSSVAHEMELLFSAADASDLETAGALTREARALMRARHDRSFVGEDRCLREAEDLWLTLEGTGQWVGYEWLLHPEGAGATAAAAMSGFGRRSRWWSQNLGLALVRALHRLDGGGWKRQAFVNGEQTIMQMLDAALAHAPEAASGAAGAALHAAAVR